MIDRLELVTPIHSNQYKERKSALLPLGLRTKINAFFLNRFGCPTWENISVDPIWQNTQSVIQTSLLQFIFLSKNVGNDILVHQTSYC